MKKSERRLSVRIPIESYGHAWSEEFEKLLVTKPKKSYILKDFES